MDARQLVVNVRLEVAKEGADIIRRVAKEMGISVNNVKLREDVVQLYGTKVLTVEQVK